MSMLKALSKVEECIIRLADTPPSIIFMDEIDILDHYNGVGIDRRMVLMATNRIHILDQALLRPARIDRKIEFPNPNEDVCISILGSCLPILQ
ncbi:26S protease regulatory subunit 8 [Tanacetum coccineum]